MSAATGPRAAVIEALAVVAGLTVAGVAAGFVWEWVWEPSIGVVFGGEWVPMSALEAKAIFSATGWYVLIAVLAGLLAGIGTALVADRRPLVTLAAVVVGSVLAGWLMGVVGSALGPPDPETLAAMREDGTRLPAALTVSGWSPRAAFPVGALLGLVMVFLGIAPRRAAGRHAADQATRDDPGTEPVESRGPDPEPAG